MQANCRSSLDSVEYESDLKKVAKWSARIVLVPVLATLTFAFYQEVIGGVVHVLWRRKKADR